MKYTIKMPVQTSVNRKQKMAVTWPAHEMNILSLNYGSDESTSSET